MQLLRQVKTLYPLDLSFAIIRVNLSSEKVKRMKMENSVFEAEVLAINEGLLFNEGLLWLSSLPYRAVEIETDSLPAVQAINMHQENVLEVGFALDDCRAYIQSNQGWTITFAERQANKATHLMAKILCLHECQSIFTSPPNLLLETLLYDVSF